MRARAGWVLGCCIVVGCAATPPSPRSGPIAKAVVIAADDFVGRADAAAIKRDREELHRVIDAWLAHDPTELRARVLRLAEAEGSYTYDLLFTLARSPNDAAAWRGRIAFADEHAHGGWKSPLAWVAYASLLLENGNNVDALLLTRTVDSADAVGEVAREISMHAMRELESDARDGAAPERVVHMRTPGRANVENGWLQLLAGDAPGVAGSVMAAMEQGEDDDAETELVDIMYERSQGTVLSDGLLRELWAERSTRSRSSRPSWASLTPKTTRGAEAFCLALLRMQLPDAALPHCVRLWPEEANAFSVADFIGELALQDPARLAHYSLTPESVFAVKHFINVAPRFARAKAQWLSAKGDTAEVAKAFRSAVVVPSFSWTFSSEMRLALALHDGALLRALAERPASRRARLFMDGLLALGSRNDAVAQIAIETLTRGQEGATDSPRAAELLVDIQRAIEASLDADAATIATAVLSIATHFGQQAGPAAPAGDSPIARLARSYRG